MVPDRMTRRHWLAILALLAGGLVPDRLLGAGPSRLRASIASGLFNRADAARIERGYYEQIVHEGRRFEDLCDLPALRRRRRSGGTFAAPVDSAPLVARVADIREVVLRPSETIERAGICWATNSQGMRDQEYAAEKPARTFRIAMVGDSIAAGWGVDVERRFESSLEKSWNERSKAAGGPSVEILDCAVPGHAPGQRWHQLQAVGWPMHPDLVICEATEADIDWDERRLRYLLARGLGFDSPLYRGALEAAEVSPGWDPGAYRHALRGSSQAILSGAYRAMAADAASHGVPIVWVLIPRVGRPSESSARATMLRSAREAGFARVVDVSNTYDGLDPARLAVEPDDFHPNAEGHARLARRLDEALSALPELSRLWSPEVQSPRAPGQPGAPRR